ncbi:MAG: C4-dicarboxylate ABC transporter, partial [Nisaea sp.]
MFLTLMALMFTGYPIGLVLGGVAIGFGCLGIAFEVFSFAEFFIFVPRVWIIAENLQLIAVPLLIFMGVMLERSQLAKDLLEALHLILRAIPGGTAISVTVMGVLFAAITGVVGASVIVLTLIALPTMLKAGYRPSLALGTIAASSTLGILIPPSILLVFLCELLQISYGYLFAAAIYPGLTLALLYVLYIA